MALLPSFTWAQTAEAKRWLDANDTVGTFQRGHMDILRWEKTHLPRPASQGSVASPWTLEDLTSRAMRGRPDLLITPGMSMAEEGITRQATLALTRDIETAWVEAIAARSARLIEAQVLEAAEAAEELAQRMRRAGNWSDAQHMSQALALWSAKSRMLEAAQVEQQTTEALWLLIGDDTLTASALAERLPPELPKLPVVANSDAAAMEAQALQQNVQWQRLQMEARYSEQALSAQDKDRLTTTPAEAAEKAQGNWPATIDPTRARWTHEMQGAALARLDARTLERAIRSNTRQALRAWQARSELARQTRQEVLRLQTALQDDIQQRYNGMLASTWDLLAAARSRLLATQAAVQAERDAWLAHINLQAVLRGLPYQGATASTPSAGLAETPTAGH
jgi:hypothetical protein